MPRFAVGSLSLIALFLLQLLVPRAEIASAIARPVEAKLQALFPDRGDAALYVFDIRTGKKIFGKNDDRVLKPASVMKVMTSVAALHLLGPEHTFRTKVLVDGIRGNHAKAVYLVGGGDPSLTIEELWKIARDVRLRGVKSIETLYVDDSYFIKSKKRVGQRAYETGTGALSLNFNTLRFEVCPGKVGAPVHIASDPPEFPVRIEGGIKTVAKGAGQFGIDEMPGAHELPLRYRARGTFGLARGCDSVYRAVPDAAQFTGVVFHGLLEGQGISVSKGPVRKHESPTASLLVAHESRPLRDILVDMNHFSSNFMAEMLLTQLGEESRGRRSHQAGVERLSAFIEAAGALPKDIVIDDGSGLSNKNRVSARVLGTIFAQGLQDDWIRVELLASLPVGGKSGTLKKRRFQKTVRAKTGTLDGVTALAGVVRSPNGDERGFVILQNKNRSRADALRLEEKVVDILASYE